MCSEGCVIFSVQESLTFHTGNLFIGGALGVAISQYKKQLGITEQKQPGKKIIVPVLFVFTFG